MRNRALAWKITGAIVFALMCWALLLLIGGAQRLKKARAAVAARGESLNWRDIVAKLPDEGFNGEHDFLAAIDGLVVSPGGLFAECFTAHGERIPLISSPAIPAEINEYTASRTIRRWTTNVWLEAEPFVGMGAANWDLARRAATNDIIKLTLNWNEGAHLRLPHLSAQKSLFAWLRMAALHDLRQGNRDAALEKIITGFRLLEIHHEPIVISLLVDGSSRAILHGAVWEMWAQDGWNDAQLARLQAAADSVRIAERMDLGLQMERSLMTAECWRVLQDPSTLKSHWASSPSAWQLVLSSTPIWKIFFSNSDFAWFLNHSGRQLEACRIGCRAQSKAAMDAAFASRSTPAPPSYLFSRRHILHAQGLGERVLIAENYRELMVAAIALKRFRLRHGRYPEKLADLLPEFLVDAPVDWMNGKELRYERLNVDKFRLWSVGRDLVDDGGDPNVAGTKSSMNPEHGRDWVWPQISPPAAIEAFIKKREAEMKTASKKP